MATLPGHSAVRFQLFQLEIGTFMRGQSRKLRLRIGQPSSSTFLLILLYTINGDPFPLFLSFILVIPRCSLVRWIKNPHQTNSIPLASTSIVHWIPSSQLSFDIPFCSQPLRYMQPFLLQVFSTSLSLFIYIFPLSFSKLLFVVSLNSNIHSRFLSRCYF